MSTSFDPRAGNPYVIDLHGMEKRPTIGAASTGEAQ